MFVEVQHFSYEIPFDISAYHKLVKTFLWSSIIYLLEKIVMNVSASLDVKIGSGSSLKYCFNMSAMSYGDKPSKSVLSVSEQQQMITLSFIVSYNWVSYRSSTFFTLCMRKKCLVA